MRLPGVSSLEAKLDAQNAATQAHREFEGQALRALETKADTIQALAERTNGRVNAHDVQLAVMEKAEEQALIVEAARVKARETAKASRVSLKQGLQVAAFTVLAGGIVTGIVSLIFGIGITN